MHIELCTSEYLFNLIHIFMFPLPAFMKKWDIEKVLEWLEGGGRGSEKALLYIHSHNDGDLINSFFLVL